MAKKKRHHAGFSRPHGRPQRREQWERRELLAEFELWITAPDAAGTVEIVGTLLTLKSEQLDSPDPALWTEELTVELLTEVVPRNVIQTRLDAMDMVPALGLFFDFLQDRERWTRESMSPHAASVLLAGLEFTVLEAAADPSRRSFSTNILTYGLERGVDPGDEESLAGYMEWYNALPHAHRVQLSDSGRLSDPEVTYDPSLAKPAPRGEHGPALFAGNEAGGHGDLPPPAGSSPRWPWFLPDADLDLERMRDWDPQHHLQIYRDSVLVQRAQAVLDFVGEGRRVTSTGALNRADTAEVLGRFGIDRTVRSMWDAPELAHTWTALHDGSWLEFAGSRVRPDSGPIGPVSADEDPEQFVDFAHALLLSALGSMWARAGREGGFLGMPDTLTTVLYVCQEGGLRLSEIDGEQFPDVPMDPRTGEQDRDAILRYRDVTSDLARLRTAGVLDGDERQVHGSGAVLIAAIGMIEIIDQMGEPG